MTEERTPKVALKFDVLMDHDLHPRRTRLLKSNSYVASTGCKNSIAWYTEKSGNVLIEVDTKRNAVLAIVGKVLEKWLDCDGHGNFRKRVFQTGLETLKKAKYQVLLGRPDDTPFTEDFDIAVETLSSLQGNIAVSPDRENFIIKERRERSLRFTRGIFEPRSQTGDSKYPSSYSPFFLNSTDV